MRRLDRSQNLGGFSAGRGIAAWFVFENESDALFSNFVGSFEQFCVHCSTIRGLICQAPEVEAADAIGADVFKFGEFLGRLNKP